MKQNKTFIPDHLIANRPKALKLIGKLAMKITLGSFQGKDLSFFKKSKV